MTDRYSSIPAFRDTPVILSETTSRLERGLRGELSALAVLDRTTRVLLDAVPADVWCGVVLDPSTLLDTGGQGAHVRAPTSAGRWISLRAWPLDQGGEPSVVVSVGPTEPAELTALVLDVYGLSPRARQIAQHVLLGRSTSEIAGHLEVSEYTVQDHLKQVFDKVGVRSRRELVAELFFRHYLPQLAHPPLSTDGRLLSQEREGRTELPENDG